MQSESAPTAKQKRGDSDSDPTQVARRSERFWFDDGSLILQVESTQFRVHRSILASYSTVFEDLFQVPQPESDKPDWIDGCLTVYMSGDTTEDWEHVLSFVYKPHSLPVKWPNVRKIAGMMRIGKKYQLDNIFEEAWEWLKAQFPENLEAYDSPMDGGIHFPDWIVIWYEDILSLGEEMALWSILPITYYLAIYYGSSAPRFLCLNPNLSLNSVRSIAHGSTTIWEGVVDPMFSWTKPDRQMLPATGCLSIKRCTIARTVVLGEVFTKIGSQDISIALDSWEKKAHHEFCGECLRVATLISESGRVHIWHNLGKYFFGDNWDKLEDTKSEICPSTWKPC